MYQQCYRKWILFIKCVFILYLFFFFNSELHVIVSCVCILPYLKKHCIHRYTPFGIHKIISLVLFWLYINPYLFKITWCFFYVTIFVKVVYEKKSIWRINCNVDIISYIPFFANFKNHLKRIYLYLSVSDVTWPQRWPLPSVSWFDPCSATVFPEPFSDPYASCSGPVTIHCVFHFNAGIFVQVHRLYVFNLP